MPYVKISRAQFQLLLVTTALKFAPMCFAGRIGWIKEAFTGLSLHSRVQNVLQMKFSILRHSDKVFLKVKVYVEFDKTCCWFHENVF